MLRTRPVWMRGLRLYCSMASAGPLDGIAGADDLFDARVHARSRFRSQDDLTRFAIYTVHDAQAWAPPTPVSEPGDHTLIVVREFRRVPLHASALAMLLLTARPRQPRVASPASAGRRPGDRPPAVARAPARPPATLRAGPDSACPDRPRRSPRTNPGTRRAPGDASRRERSRRGRSARSPACAVG